MELFSFTLWKYNFVFTPCCQSPLCFTLGRFWHTRARPRSKTLHQSSNKYSLSMCCLLLDKVSNPGLIAVRYVQRAHRLWPLAYQSKTDVRTLNTSLTRENKIDKFRSSRFVTSKAWRQFFSALEMTNEAVCSIPFVANSVNGGRFLEFTEANWKVYWRIFSLYEIISLWEKTLRL